MGATTIWERWDGIKPDGTFQTPSMNSFNHYAYGSIGDWMYRVIAGISPDEEAPGYKKIIIKPHLTDSLSFAAASLQTYYGIIRSEWKREQGNVNWKVEIPINTTVRIYLPAADADAVAESNKKLNTQKEIKILGNENGYLVVEAGSGTYSFVITDPKTTMK